MIRNLALGALLLSASIAHAVTIGAQNASSPQSERCAVQQKSAQQKKVVRKVVQKKKAAEEAKKTVEVVHHHHHYHPRVEQGRRHVRRHVYYHTYRQPVRVVRSQRFQPRSFYPAPAPGVGLHYVLR